MKIDNENIEATAINTKELVEILYKTSVELKEIKGLLVLLNTFILIGLFLFVT